MLELARSIDHENDVSWRTLKIALTSFRLADASRFVPFLTHPHPRMRFTVVDIIRQIAGEAARDGLLNKNDFSPELYATFLDRLVVDDVRRRARAQRSVVAHFRDARALRALRTLLNDDNDFVRLHAVRAAATASTAICCPTSRVACAIHTGGSGKPPSRRAALRQRRSERALPHIPRERRRRDRPADHRRLAARRGMPTLLASLTTAGMQSTLASAVCQKMAAMGNTVYLNRALASVDDARGQAEPDGCLDGGARRRIPRRPAVAGQRRPWRRDRPRLGNPAQVGHRFVTRSAAADA